MALSNELISQFAKATVKREDTKKESIVYGTVKYDGRYYVKLDGSDFLTPVTTTTNISDGQRVTVMIKNHTATVTGNIDAPSARSTDVDKATSNVVTQFGTIVADKISTEQFATEQLRVNNMMASSIDAAKADIGELLAKKASIEELNAESANIKNLVAEKIDADIVEANYATIKNLEATNANINNLQATYGEFEVLTAEQFRAHNAEIVNLKTNKLSTTDADIKYANIDFANIGSAAMEYFYAKSGLIDNVVVGDASITGLLVGVTIKGDLIEGNTVVADKLVIRGTDGLYYKLNTAGLTDEEGNTITEAEQTDYNSLNGQIIAAKSITASKIDVEDLVAFNATIGGFEIGSDSISSTIKDSEDNTVRGIYMDKDGQFNFGDANNFVRYYKDDEGNYKLAISAESILYHLNGSNHSIADIGALTDYVKIGMYDQVEFEPNGQTFDSFEYNTLTNVEYTDSYHKLSNGSILQIMRGINEDGNELYFFKSNNWYYVVDRNIDYSEPCIELGSANSDFKLIITNTRIMFKDGDSTPAYIDNQAMNIGRAVIDDELQIGGFVWKRRSNGNVGLMWKGEGN